VTAPVLEPTGENLETAAECIDDGGVVVAPSDTNLALTLDPWQSDAVDRAYAAKGRPEHEPLTLFARDPDAWREYATHDDPEHVHSLVESFWYGPLNLVLLAAGPALHADDRLTRDGTVSIGCLSNPTWRDLAARVDGPVAMTSANESGTVDDDTLVGVEFAREHVGGSLDYHLDGSAQGTTRASTILDLTDGPEYSGEATSRRPTWRMRATDWARSRDWPNR